LFNASIETEMEAKNSSLTSKKSNQAGPNGCANQGHQLGDHRFHAATKAM
jgi:hypothetical protein